MRCAQSTQKIRPRKNVVGFLYVIVAPTLSASHSLGTSPIGEAGVTDAEIIYISRIDLHVKLCDFTLAK